MCVYVLRFITLFFESHFKFSIFSKHRENLGITKNSNLKWTVCSLISLADLYFETLKPQTRVLMVKC
jgi:hypothetical protein